MKRLTRKTITKRQQQGRKDAKKRKYHQIYQKGRISGMKYISRMLQKILL